MAGVDLQIRLAHVYTTACASKLRRVASRSVSRSTFTTGRSIGSQVVVMPFNPADRSAWPRKRAALSKQNFRFSPGHLSVQQLDRCARVSEMPFLLRDTWIFALHRLGLSGSVETKTCACSAMPYAYALCSVSWDGRAS